MSRRSRHVGGKRVQLRPHRKSVAQFDPKQLVKQLDKEEKREAH